MLVVCVCGEKTFFFSSFGVCAAGEGGAVLWYRTWTGGCGDTVSMERKLREGENIFGYSDYGVLFGSIDVFAKVGNSFCHLVFLN